MEIFAVLPEYVVTPCGLFRQDSCIDSRFTEFCLRSDCSCLRKAEIRSTLKWMMELIDDLIIENKSSMNFTRK